MLGSEFGPEIRRRAYGRHRSWRGLNWHVDETRIRVNGCYLWRAGDQLGQLIDVRLTPRRNASVARALPCQARETVRLSQPLIIVTDKAQSYVRGVGETAFIEPLLSNAVLAGLSDPPVSTVGT